MHGVEKLLKHRRRDLKTASIPSTVGALLWSFRYCFSLPSFDSFVTLVTGFILCPGRHSISRVIQAGLPSAPRKHHSTLYRFLSRGRWLADSLGHMLFHLLLPLLPAEILAIVDDTLCHRSGPHLFGAGMHHDASRSTYGRGTAAGRRVEFAFGHNWVVLGIWVPVPWLARRGLAVPILFRLYRSKKRCPTAEYRKRTEIAVELLSLLAQWLPPGRRLHVTGDAEYFCRTVIRGLPDGVAGTGPLPMGAALFELPGPYGGRGRRPTKGKRLPTPKALAADRSAAWVKLVLPIYGRNVDILVKTLVCLWPTVAGHRPVRVVITRDPKGRIEDRVYGCTDAKRSVEEILSIFSRRWSVEVAFRDAKQAMGIEDPQNGWWRRKSGTKAPKKRPGPNPRGHRGETATEHTFPLIFAAYGIVIVWYLQHGDRAADVAQARREAPWYAHKTGVSFEDMLAALRREIWAARISANPLLRRVLKNVWDLLPRWLLAA